MLPELREAGLLSPQLLPASLAIALEILCVLSSLELISILQPRLAELPTPARLLGKLGKLGKLGEKGKGSLQQLPRGAEAGRGDAGEGARAGHHPGDSSALDWGH